MATHPRCWIYCTKYLLHQVIIQRDITGEQYIGLYTSIHHDNILLLVCDLKQQLIGLGDRCNYRTLPYPTILFYYVFIYNIDM